jgi:hypothetical protein
MFIRNTRSDKNMKNSKNKGIVPYGDGDYTNEDFNLK